LGELTPGFSICSLRSLLGLSSIRFRS
jgi:hypothetical protein